jgi:hypothetical protein
LQVAAEGQKEGGQKIMMIWDMLERIIDLGSSVCSLTCEVA